MVVQYTAVPLGAEEGSNALYVGPKAQLLEYFAAQPLLLELTNKLSPRFDKYDAKETYSLAGSSLRRVCLAALPTVCSRHNCRALPHAITDAVREHKGEGELHVTLLLQSAEDALAAGCAVARAFSLYALKKKVSEPVLCTVHIPALSTGSNSANTLAVLTLLAQQIQAAAALVDMPCNVLNTTTYTQQALDQASSLPGVTTQVRPESVVGRTH